MNNKKKVLGVDPLSWIKQTKEDFETNQEEEKNKTKKSEVPKFETYDVRLTLRLNEDQLDFLSGLEREVMKNRSSKNKKERITKNSIIRAMLENLKYLDFDKKEIPDEKTLQNRIKNAVKEISYKPF